MSTNSTTLQSLGALEQNDKKMSGRSTAIGPSTSSQLTSPTKIFLKNTDDASDPARLKKLFEMPLESSKEYKRMKLKNIIYQIGDPVLVKNESDSLNDFIGKILKIRSHSTPGEKSLVVVLVQWYYRKSDILTGCPKIKGLKEILSDNEVFLSEHKDAIHADSINGPCKILTLKEYDENEDSRLDHNTFFARAVWNHEKKSLDPPIEKWDKYCLCQKPINPDLPVIQCDKCNEWYHLACVNITVEKACEIENYYCKGCESGPKSAKKTKQTKQSAQL